MDDTVVTDLKEATLLYARIVASGSTLSVEELCSSDVFKKIQSSLSEKKNSITRTGLLWVQYLEMVNILRKFLKAERTGNWRLHLESVREMLPFFAASGHTLYAESAHVYLQTMLELPRTHPDLYQKFEAGFHVVRRSDRYWAGLSTDLIVEQVLMQTCQASRIWRETPAFRTFLTPKNHNFSPDFTKMHVFFQKKSTLDSTSENLPLSHNQNLASLL